MAKKNIVASMKKLSSGYGSFDSKIELGSAEDKTNMTIKVRSGLPITDYGEMVLDITQACFLRDGSSVSFAPYLMHLAFAMCTAKYYTDLEVPDGADGQEVFWNFWNANGMEEKIAVITHDQIYMVYDAAKAMIDELNCQNNDVVNRISQVLSDALNKLTNTDLDASAIYDFISQKEDIIKILDRVQHVLDTGDVGAIDRVSVAFAAPMSENKS